MLQCYFYKYIFCQSNVELVFSESFLFSGDISAKVKIKDCVPECAAGSMNMGLAKTSLACCNTDQCNLQDAPGIVLYRPYANEYL